MGREEKDIGRERRGEREAGERTENKEPRRTGNGNGLLSFLAIAFSASWLRAVSATKSIRSSLYSRQSENVRYQHSESGTETEIKLRKG